MYRCKGTVGLCLMVPFLSLSIPSISDHAPVYWKCCPLLSCREGVFQREKYLMYILLCQVRLEEKWRRKVSDAPYLYHHFGVILVAALLTCFIPLGKYDTKEITYTVNGSEKQELLLIRTVSSIFWMKTATR